MGHCRRTFLSRLKAFFNFTDFGSLEMPQFNGNHFAGVANSGTCPHVFSVTITRNNLSGWDCFQTQRMSNMLFHLGINIGIGAHCSREFAHCDVVARSNQPASIAIDL